MMDYSTTTVSDSSRCGPNDLREELRDLILQTCADKKDLVFRISECRIKHEEWLQDITSMITTGQTLHPLAGQLLCSVIPRKPGPSFIAMGRNVWDEMSIAYLGEIHGLFDQSDRDKLSLQVKTAPDKPESVDPSEGWEAVLALIQRKIHFVISMSSFGEAFRCVHFTPPIFID